MNTPNITEINTFHLCSNVRGFFTGAVSTLTWKTFLKD